MKISVLGNILLLFLCLGTGFVFAQGANTQAGATSVPITLPFNSNGTTVGATNNFDQAGYNFDDGPDWYYYYCATNSNTIWLTITFTPSTTNPVYPSVSILSSTGTLLAETQIYGDLSGTYGIPFTPIAGECYYFIIDNDGVTGPSGFNYNIQMTNTVPTTPVDPLQPACTNIGFDNGSTSGWVGSWGHSIQTGIAPAPTPTYTPLFFTMNAGHHNITTGGVDIQAPIQQVCPMIPGNTNSLMLGDGPNGAYGGATIEQKFQVTSSNALFTYYYAVVIQDGGASGSTAHTDQEQPFFKIDALDCTGNPISCGNYLVTGGPGIPGFTQIGTSGTYWKDWTPVMLDLTPYIGSCVTVRFTIGDCSIGAHYAYAYLDATCAPMEITGPPNVCQYQTSDIVAPAGAATYSWVETSNPGTVIGTSNILSITPTTTGSFNYQCTMTSVTGCNSTLSYAVNVLPSPQITVTDPPPVCSPNTVDITSSSVVTITSGSGTISYYSDAACTVPIASPSAINASGTYYIKILNSNGCYDVQPVTVVVNSTPTVDVTTSNQTICAGQSVNLNATISPAGYTSPVTFTNTTDFNITDASVTATQSPITVSGINQQTPGVLPIVSLTINIDHTYDEDLTIRLQCPNGSVIELSSANGSDGDNYTNTTFVPSGAPSITTGTAPFTGNFTPEQAFSLLNSCAVNGTWTLLVYDLASGDVGTLLDWSITFDNYIPTTYSWSPTTNMTNTTTLTPTVTPTATTTYTFTGTNPQGGCTATDQVTITISNPTATIGSDATVCQNATAPTITFTGANGNPPYTFTYNINGGANQTVSSGAGSTATVTAPTTTSGTFVYNLVSVATGVCNQSQTGSATVTVNPLPTITGTLNVCVGGTTQLTGSGTAAASNPWASSNTGVATVSNTGLVSGVAAGTSTITYTNSNGCQITATVTVNPLPTITGTLTVCVNGTTQLSGSATPAASNPWTSSATGVATISNAGLVTGVSAGTTTITYTNSNGCQTTATVTVNPLPTITGILTVCVNGTTQLSGSASPAASNPWASSNTGVATVSNTGLVTGVSGGTSTITYTNSNGCQITATVTVNPLPTITGTLNVCVNGTTQLSGSASPAASSPWTSSATGVATISNTGLVTGVSAGTTTITYTNSNGCQTTATVTVNPLPTITGTLTVCVNGTTQLSGSASPAASNPWASSNTGVATVSNTGLVTGVSGGTSTITYTNSNGCQITATVTVNPLPTITGTLNVCVNGTTQLSGSASPAASSPWTSSATGVATISNTGLVTGVSAGTTTITYTNSNGCQTTATVTVNPLPTISGTLTVCEGATTQLTGSGTAASSNPWASSNTGVATVSNTGLVTGVSSGTTAITYTNSNGCQITETVTVNPAPTISGVFTVCAGSMTQLTGSGTPDVTTPWTSSSTSVATVSNTGLVTGITPGTSTITYTNSNGCSVTQVVTITSGAAITGTLSVCVNGTTQLTGSGTAASSNAWTSSNTAVATVSNSGLVTGISAGTTAITYTNSSGCNDIQTVTVQPLPTVTGSDVCVGSTTQLSGSGTPDATAPWTSSNTAIATISNTGVMTGVAVGSVTITYTNSNGCQNTVALNVVPLPTISGILTVCEGGTTQLTGSGTPDVTTPWTSSNTAVATVSNTGLVTGISAGTATITYTNSGGCQTTATVTINPLPTIGGTLTVCEGSTTQLSGSGTPDATAPWTSSNTAVATISNTGLVTGVSAGTTTITYTNNNGCSQTATVTVNPLPTASISGTSSICAGTGTSFTITGTPDASVTYSNGATNQTVQLDNTGSASVNTGVLNTTTTYTLVSAQSAAPASCSNTLNGSITITVNPNPVMDPVTSVAVCPGDQVSIPSFVSNPSGATFDWTNTNGSIGLATTGSGDIPVFTATNSGANPISGTITVIPTLNGCPGSSQTFTIGVSNSPVANAGSDVSLCLDAVSGNQIGSAPLAGMSYSWSPTAGLSDPSIANPTVSTASSGTTTYTVTVTNAIGCSSTDDVTVTIHALPVVSFVSNVTEGCAPVQIIFTNTSAGSVNCQWDFEGAGIQNDCGPVTQLYSNAGIFDVTLTITDNNGCSNSLTQTDMITIYPEVIASFGVNQLTTTVLDPTFHFTNTSVNATTYQWTFGDGLTSTQTNPIHTYVDEPGTYHVVLHASNAAGCNDTAVVVLQVLDELIYYVPNTFTPDGDEFNNVFFPVFSSGFDDQSYTLLIFDRWGEVIFESHDISIGWDGTYHNELCKEGVYTWKIVIKEKNKDKRHDLVGHVTLLK